MGKKSEYLFLDDHLQLENSDIFSEDLFQIGVLTSGSSDFPKVCVHTSFSIQHSIESFKIFFKIRERKNFWAMLPHYYSRSYNNVSRVVPTRECLLLQTYERSYRK